MDGGASGDAAVPTRLIPLDDRLPSWDRASLRPRDCPFCAAGDHPARWERPDGLVVRACPGCGARYISPAPDETELARFYATYDVDHRRGEDVEPSSLAAEWDAEDPHRDFRVAELSSLRDLRGCRVVDVGFGRGKMLYQLRRLGADVFGVEIDPHAVARARAMGIPAFEGPLERAPQGPYDVVVLKDLVEHPLDPMALLRAAVERLAPSGVLLIWTPNAQSREGGGAPTTYRVDLEHMQYLAPRTVARVARELQLDMIHLETVGYPILARSSLSPMRRALRRALRRSGLLAHARAGRRRDLRRGDYHLLALLSRR